MQETFNSKNAMVAKNRRKEKVVKNQANYSSEPNVKKRKSSTYEYDDIDVKANIKQVG